MTTTRDGGMQITMKAKLIEIGGDECQPCAMFERVDKHPDLTPSGQFKVLVTVDELRELAPLLYRELEVTISVVPTRRTP